jgi:hypothetical protein
MKMYIEQEIDNAQAQWMRNRRFTPSAQTNALIRREVENYLEEAGGYPAQGSLAEQPPAAPLIPPHVIAWIESPLVSSFEQRRRYSTDKEFKRYYDLYANQQRKAKIAQETSGVTLTVEQYRALPAATVIQRYRREKGFKIAVDKLIAEGRI